MEEQVGKRLRSLVAVSAVALVMAFVLSGCSSIEGFVNKTTYEPQGKDSVVVAPTIGEDGVLRVGVDTSNPPLAGMNSSGKIIGIDVDLAAALADEFGLKVSIVDVGSDPAGALEEGKVDIVMGVDKADASDDFWMSDAYLPTGIALFSLEEGAAVPTAGDGSTFAAQISSKSAWAITNEFGDDVLVSSTTLNDAFASLSAGEVDYVAADAVVGLYAARTQNLDVYISAMLLAPSGYCIGVSADNAELQNLVGEAVKNLSGNGVIGVIEMKWLGKSVDLSDVKLTAGVPLETQSEEEAEAEAALAGGSSNSSTATDTSAATSANRP